jgi:hypothetical protein
MSSPIKFPSARQPVTMVDGNGQEVFTRPWFLFFQAVYERAGGAIGAGTGDLSESLFEDAGSGETNALLFSAEQALLQSIQTDQAVTLEVLVNEVLAQREQIAELVKELDSIKQGVQL